jgi:hypothetical protein
MPAAEDGGGAPSPDGAAQMQKSPAQPSASQNGQATPASVQPAQAPVDPAAAKHHAIGKFFTNVLNGGSGSSASRMWRSVIASAIVGMGAAEDAPVVARGPYGDVRDKSIGGAASRGLRAGMGLAQQQEDRQRAQAEQDNENKRRERESQIQADDAVLRKQADARAQQASIQNSVEHEKRMKMLDQSIASGNWEQSQRTAKSAQDQVAFFNSLQDVGATPLSGADGEPLQFGTHEEAEKAAHDNPKFFIGNFKTRTAYDPGTGKYGIYRVPDTDIKNVKLKDPISGQTHTIPRMTPSEYLDYQARVQNIQKGAVGIEEARARLTQIREDRKSSSAYGKALAELDKVDGDADQLSPSSRTLLYSTASKNLGEAIRAKTAADKAEDAEASSAASAAIQHYSGVLSGLHGNKPPAQTAAQSQAATRAQALFSKEDNSAEAFNIVNAQVKAGTISKEEGQAIMAEYMKVKQKTQAAPKNGMTDDVQAPADNSEPSAGGVENPL